MAIVSSFYGTLIEGDAYFAARLHEYAWSEASSDNREKALRGATAIIDKLNYKGDKATVYALLQSNPSATLEEIRAQEAAQELEFPRGADTDVPEDIRKACYEIAHSLLDGKDPEMELEMLGVSSQGVSSVRTTFARNQSPVEHIVNGVPSATAWRYMRPYLRDDGSVQLVRVS
jgi:hypothetical protein